MAVIRNENAKRQRCWKHSEVMYGLENGTSFIWWIVDRITLYGWCRGALTQTPTHNFSATYTHWWCAGACGAIDDDMERVCVRGRGWCARGTVVNVYGRPTRALHNIIICHISTYYTVAESILRRQQVILLLLASLVEWERENLWGSSFMS